MLREKARRRLAQTLKALPFKDLTAKKVALEGMEKILRVTGNDWQQLGLPYGEIEDSFRFWLNPKEACVVFILDREEMQILVGLDLDGRGRERPGPLEHPLLWDRVEGKWLGGTEEDLNEEITPDEALTEWIAEILTKAATARPPRMVDGRIS